PSHTLPATTPAPTAPPATAFTAPITETAGPPFLRPRFVPREITPVQIRAVQCLDRFLRLLGIRHFDEAEAAGTAGKLMGNHPGRLNSPVRREDFLKLRIGGRIRQSTHVNFTAHVLSFMRMV